MGIDIKHLKAFVALAGNFNFHEAAARLNITQPALSKRVKTLEDSFGYRLFYRDAEGVRLTRLAEELPPYAKKNVIQFDKLLDLSKELAQGEQGTLDIGFGLSSIRVAPELVARFRQKHPRIKVVLEDMSSSAQASRLSTGQLQIGFMSQPANEELDFLPLYKEQLAIAVNAAHQEAFQQYTPVGQVVESLPYLKLHASRGPSLNQQIQQYLDHHRI